MTRKKQNPIVFPIAVGPAIAGGFHVSHALESSLGLTQALLAGAAFCSVTALVLGYGLQAVVNRFSKPNE